MSKEKSDTDIYGKAFPDIANINVYGNGCVGCIRHKRDIMISFNENDEEKSDIPMTPIYDVLLTTKQAKRLRDEIDKVLGQNFEEKV